MTGLAAKRRDIPAVWEDVNAEVRAGRRRYGETDPGERFANTGWFEGEGDFSPPGVRDRTLGDWLDPTRPGRTVDIVNAVSREVGSDVAGWRFTRTLEFFAAVEQATRQRPEI